MRIIAGRAKGRRLRTPAAGTRPPTGRLREAVFSALGDRVVDARVLDLYAGSGSFGLEALSRGAESAVFVEQGRQAVRALRANVAAVGLGGEVQARSVASFLASPAGPLFDLVFVDPPYRMSDAAVEHVLDALAGRVAPGGIVLLHRRAGGGTPAPEFLRFRSRRRYGDAELWWFERQEEES